MITAETSSKIEPRCRGLLRTLLVVVSAILSLGASSQVATIVRNTQSYVDSFRALDTTLTSNRIIDAVSEAERVDGFIEHWITEAWHLKSSHVLFRIVHSKQAYNGTGSIYSTDTFYYQNNVPVYAVRSITVQAKNSVSTTTFSEYFANGKVIVDGRKLRSQRRSKLVKLADAYLTQALSPE